MQDVKRSVVISAEQDAFANEYRQRFGLSRSQVVRMALDKLMGDPPFSLRENLALSKGDVHDEQVEAVAYP